MKWEGPGGWRRALVIVGVLGVVALLAWGLLSPASTQGIDGALAEGRLPPAPPLALPVLVRGDGGPKLARPLTRAQSDGQLDLAELRGHVVVVNFWASWCIPCLLEAPLLEEQWGELKRDGVVLLAVDTQDTSHGARRFLDYFESTFPMVEDADERVNNAWQISRLPQTFFVTPRGQVAAHVTGVISPELIEEGLGAAREGRALHAIAGG